MKKILVAVFLLGCLAALAQNPVALYTFSGNANDGTSNANNGTVNGAIPTTDRFGAASSAYSFDGVDDYIVIANEATLNISAQITVSAWIRINNLGINDQAVVSKGDIGNIAYILNVFGSAHSSPGVVEFGSQSFANYVESTTRIDDGAYHHIAGTSDGSTLKIYIDGVLDNQLAASGTLSVNAGSLYIGAHETTGPVVTRFTDGSIDDVKIYDMALSATDVQNLFNVEEGLIAHYSFSGNANDESGNGNDGTVTGALPTTDRFGNANSAYSFDGVDDFIDLGTSTSGSFQNVVTMAAWVKAGAQGSGTIVSRGLGFRLEKRAGDVINFGTFPLSNDILETTTVFDDDIWHFIVGTYDGSTKSLYVDGFLEAEALNVTGTAGQAGLLTLIGNQAAVNDFFDGDIDDISIYNRALSASEVLALSIDDVPTIATFLPASGSIGTSVTIVGTNFDEIPANNIVYFGATQATVSSATSTELTVTVPVGATYQPITILVDELTAYSSAPFAVTFDGGSITTNSLESMVEFTTETNPYYMTIGDLDGDGKADLIVPNFESNSVSVFRNTSVSGTLSVSSFSGSVNFDTGEGPTAVSVGDLDGDGKPDLAVSNWTGKSVSILRNTSVSGTLSSGSFSSKVDILTGDEAFSVAIRDLDGDGKADLAVANKSSNTVSILRNTSVSGSLSASSFSPKVDINIGTGTNPLSVAIGDLDGDGKADLAVTNFESNNISVFRNTSVSGTLSLSSFSSKEDFATGARPYSVSIGDLDGDGKPDLAVANRNSNTVSVFKNMSVSGTISMSRLDFPTEAGGEPWSVSIGDLDGDGKADLAVGNEASNSVSVFRNTSTIGTIDATSFQSRVDFVAGAGSRSVSIGDLDGDGIADLAVSNYDGNSVSVFRNTVVLPPNITSFTPASGPVRTTVTITGTGFDATPANNIVFFGATQATISAATVTQLTVTVPPGATYEPITVLTNGLLGYSSAPFEVAFGGDGIDVNTYDDKIDYTTGTTPLFAASGDLDGDGLADLAVVNFTDNTVSVFRNSSTGSGTVSHANKVDLVTGNGPTSVSISDLDGDGLADLAVTNFTDDNVSVLRNTNTAVGTISYATRVDFGVGTGPIKLSIGDLDGDGKSDLAVANFSGTNVSILRNTGTGPGAISYATKVDLVAGTAPISVAIADLDSDGRVDLTVVNNNDDNVLAFRNTSTETGIISFSNSVSVLSVGTSPTSVATGDVDGDGKTDLVVTNVNGGNLSVLRNNSSSAGTISFDTKMDFNTGSSPNSVSIGDLDGDGLVDLAVASLGDNMLSLFRNTSTGAGSVSYDTRVDFSTGTQPRMVSIADVDNDGKVDLAVPNEGGHSISLFRNAIIIADSPTQFSDFVTPSTYTVGDGGLAVGVTVTELDGLFSVSIHFKKVNADFFTKEAMTENGGVYTFSLEDANIDNTGVQYYFEVEDVNAHITKSATFLTSVLVPDDSETLTNVSFGSTIEAYRIVAFPYQSFSSNLLIDDLGSYDKEKWRLSRYNGGAYQDLNEFGSIAPGEGYWFIMLEQTTISIGGQSVLVDDNGIFRINLTSGFNLIGNPFKGTLDWNSTVQHNITQGVMQSGDIDAGSTSALAGWNGSWADRSSLSQNEGGFVNMRNAVSNFEIPISALSGGGRVENGVRLAQTAYIDEPNWEMRLFFNTPSYSYSFGGIGMHPEALDGSDTFDRSLPPQFLLYLDLQFADGKTRSIKQSDYFKTWNFTVPNNLDENILSLTWDKLESSRNTVILVDASSKRLYDLKEVTQLSLPNDPAANHQLYFGDKETILSSIELPFDALYSVYPNPIQGQFTLQMYSSSDKNVSVELISLDGKSVPLGQVFLTKGMSSNRIDISNSVRNGVYLLKVGEDIMTRVLKN